MTKISSTDEWRNAIKLHIQKLNPEDKYEFAHNIIFDVALWTGYNDYEMIGILEAAKADMIETLRITA